MSNINNEIIYHQLIVNLGGVNKVFISKFNLLDSEKATKNKMVKEAVRVVVNKVFNDNLSDEYKKELKKDFYKKIECSYGSTINNFLEFHNDYNYIELIPVKKIERKKESIEVFTSVNKTEILEGEKFKKVYDMDLYICKEVIDKENNFIRYYLVDKNNKMILFSSSIKKRLIERLNDFLEKYSEQEIKSLIEKFLIKVGQKEEKKPQKELHYKRGKAINKFIVVRYDWVKDESMKNEEIKYIWGKYRYKAGEIIKEFDNEKDALIFCSELNIKYNKGKMFKDMSFQILNSVDDKKELEEFKLVNKP